MRLHHRWRVGAVAALVLLAAACSESSGPASLSDPAALDAELSQVQGTFESSLYSSFSGLSFYMAPPGSPAAAALRLSAPDRAVASDQSRRFASAQAVRTMIGALSGPQTGPIIADSLYGRAYEWDEVADTYVQSSTRSGPANGVRFFLYETDPNTDLPVEPVNELGYADLMDESASPTDLALHVVVRSTGGTTFLDYTVSVAGSTGTFSASSVGFVSNGQIGTALRRLDFDIAFAASQSATSTTLTADATLTFNNASVSIELHDQVTVSDTEVTFQRDFRFHRPGEVVVVQGNVTVGEATVTGSLTILVNGGTFVRATFTGTSVTVSRQLTASEQAVMSRLLEASDDVWDVIESLFNPAELFAS